MGAVHTNGREAALGPGELASARRDVAYLAGELPHRGGITENERRAAEYLEQRFREYTPLVQLEDFYSTDAYPLVFAMYYAEFLVVGVVAMFWPWIALGYGVAVFLLYMAEFTGYSSMGRFLPHYETQNVTARMPCARAERMIVVTAHYDSPRAYPWTEGPVTGRLRLYHLALVGAMLLVLVSCGAEGVGAFADGLPRFDLAARAVGVAVLLVGAGVMFNGARNARSTPGANNNASGCAVLLEMASRLKESPLGSSEVMLVATGAKELWLSGMRQLCKGLDSGTRELYFVNIAGVGAGQLRYVTGEGMLHVYRSGAALHAAAEHEGPSYAARPLVWRGLPTDALIPMARGFEAITVMATGPEDLPVAWNSEEDSPARVDHEVLSRSAGFVEAILRRLDAGV
jgi:hypothetical protein